jgi:hypothetical protein
MRVSRNHVTLLSAAVASVFAAGSMVTQVKRAAVKSAEVPRHVDSAGRPVKQPKRNRPIKAATVKRAAQKRRNIIRHRRAMKRARG